MPAEKKKYHRDPAQKAAYMAEYRRRNAIKLKAQARAWREKNADRAKVTSRVYSQTHREQYRAWARKYYAKRREHIRAKQHDARDAHNAKRIARIIESAGPLPTLRPDSAPPTRMPRLARADREMLKTVCAEWMRVASLPKQPPEFAAIGVKWNPSISLEEKIAKNRILRRLERHGLILRQYVFGRDDTGARRTRASDPIWRTTHVQPLPAGLAVNRVLCQPPPPPKLRPVPMTAEEKREKKRVYAAINRGRNPEAAKARQQRYEERHPERYRAIQAAYRERNRDKIRGRHVKKIEARRAAVLASPIESPAMSSPQLRRMLKEDAAAYHTITANLGRRQRHLLAYIARQYDELQKTVSPAFRLELDRLGVPWQIDGSARFQATCNASVRTLERRGYILRQNITGNPKTHKPRVSPKDPHQQTTHIQILPAGLKVGRCLLHVVETRQKLLDWKALKIDQRREVILELAEWRCRSGPHYGRSNSQRGNVLNLFTCLSGNQEPTVKLPWTMKYGCDEITWNDLKKNPYGSSF